jgi:hypothetical protein
VTFQSNSRPATILVNELDAGCLEGAPDREVVGGCHDRLLLGEFGSANGCNANG